ncbi:PREDICTED: probable inactive beta-glucosidase 25 [Tarenaya hassleriana]|uniref:probable inactive beta-glucosidase 25 n=1 Tax=Tarenaya hassleriana TaxID=28532 RepID=UPI00053C5EE4|nr:PREDICTED: probable inactive beta-glucosidase 25 [Tarenaya hassleriana]
MLKKIFFLGSVLVLVLAVVAAAGEPVCPESDSLGRGSFPDGFMFGAAISAFQHEGAPEEGGRGPSIWDSFVLKHPERYNNPDGKARDGRLGVDFYHHYKEDIQLLKKLNMDALRFSISWPRIFPHGRKDKGVNEAGVKFYNDLINELIANGITPFVTLFHWDVPQGLEDEYNGFLSSRIVEDFREFAKFAFDEYGDRVKHWVTINEPYEFSRGGYDTGEKAPGRCSKYVNEKCHDGQSGHEVYTVSHNLLLAHSEAVEEFRKCEKCKGGKIGIVQSPMWFEPYDPKSTSPPPQEIVKSALDFTLGWHMSPITHGDYPQKMKDNVGERLPSFTPEQKQKLKNSYDFIGINYYSSAFVAHVADVDPQKPTWEADSRVQWHLTNIDGYKIGTQPPTAKFPVSADGLKKILNHIKDIYGDPEIIITGNGYKEMLGDKDGLIPDATSDHNRKYCHMRHLMNLHGAVCQDKMNVKGYFVWSLMDGFEWEDGFGTRSGLYYIDYGSDNLTRHEKASAKWLSKLLEKDPNSIRSKGASDAKKEL